MGCCQSNKLKKVDIAPIKEPDPKRIKWEEIKSFDVTPIYSSTQP